MRLDYNYARIIRGTGYSKRIIRAAVVHNDNLVDKPGQGKQHFNYKALLVMS